MLAKYNNKSLIVLYNPDDLQWAAKISFDLRQKFDYSNKIILTPLSRKLSERKFVMIGTMSIPTINIFKELLNASEITGMSLNEQTQMPEYPEHSILLVEIDNKLHDVIRTIWASNKYFDDVGTFASKALRRKEMARALDMLD